MDAPDLDRAPSRGRMRRVLVFVLKASVTLSLLAWLIQTGSLDMSRLSVLVSSAEVTLVTLVTWASMTVAMSTARWKVMLGAVGAHVSFPRAAALQTMALFFNGVVPGNVGGDLIKNHSVLGKQGGKLVVLMLVERTVGLISLVWTAGLGLLLSAPRLGGDSRLSGLAAFIVALMVASVGGTWLFLAKVPRALDRARPANGGFTARLRTKARELAASAVATLTLVRDAKSRVAGAFAISSLMHLGNAAYFLYLARHLGNPEASYGQMLMVFPVGMLSLVVPISVSGLGVGHFMFDELFAILGLQGGANVFNAYTVAQLSLCLLGAIPYLVMRSRNFAPATAEEKTAKANASHSAT